MIGAMTEPQPPASPGSRRPESESPEPQRTGADNPGAGDPGASDAGAGDAGAEFGPRGYLPPRAAARARKIVLREPLGLAWVVASVLAGIALLGLGAAFLWTQSQPPSEPFVTAGALEQVDPRGATQVEAGGIDAVVVRGGGGLRAFAAPDGEIAWCAESRRLEGAAGQVWERDGRLVGGAGSSLTPLRFEVHDGELYIDPTPLESRTPDDRGEQPACRP